MIIILTYPTPSATLIAAVSSLSRKSCSCVRSGTPPPPPSSPLTRFQTCWVSSHPTLVNNNWNSHHYWGIKIILCAGFLLVKGYKKYVYSFSRIASQTKLRNQDLLRTCGRWAGLRKRKPESILFSTHFVFVILN